MTSPPIPATLLGPERWIGYIRVSTWREEAISPDIQRDAIERWAARTGRRIIEWVIDLDATGRNFRRRVMGAIEAVERGDAKGIAVWKYSRFGRNTLGVQINVARLENSGGQLVSATEDIDVSTAIGEFQRDITFALANFESKRAGEQWRETHGLRVKAKLPATGRPRFGYIWQPRRVQDPSTPTGWRLQDEHYTLHPDMAPVLDELYERKTEDHDGFTSLARWMNEDLQITSPRGRIWSNAFIGQMMDAGFAAGLLRIHDPECRCPYRTKPGTASRCTEGRMIFVPGAQPAILNPDRWQAYLDHRAQVRATPPRARRATYPLTALVYHAVCRRSMSAQTITVKGVPTAGAGLQCGWRLRAGPAGCGTPLHAKRAVVEAQVQEWLAREASGVAARDALEAPATPRRDTREEDRRSLAETEAALTQLVIDRARHPDLYPVEAFEAARDTLLRDRERLTARLQQAATVTELPDRATLEPLAARLVEAWDGLSPVEINGIMRRLVRRVVVGSDRAPGEWSHRVRVEVHPTWEDDPWE